MYGKTLCFQIRSTIFFEIFLHEVTRPDGGVSVGLQQVRSPFDNDIGYPLQPGFFT